MLMKIKFEYDPTKDIWCLLNYGKNSNNSASPTKRYLELVNSYGESPTEGDVAAFVEKYLSEKQIDVSARIVDYQQDWETIAEQYQKIAESIFKVSIPKDVTAYFTINNRCPYNIEHNLFFMSLSATSARDIAMHELWHFYTWYKFGITWEDKIGKQRYNDIKESLTVLLNTECSNLFPEGASDIGYPQHKELRDKILQLWSETKDIDKVWESLID